MQPGTFGCILVDPMGCTEPVVGTFLASSGNAVITFEFRRDPADRYGKGTGLTLHDDPGLIYDGCRVSISSSGNELIIEDEGKAAPADTRTASVDDAKAREEEKKKKPVQAEVAPTASLVTAATTSDV